MVVKLLPFRFGGGGGCGLWVVDIDVDITMEEEDFLVQLCDRSRMKLDKNIH